MKLVYLSLSLLLAGCASHSTTQTISADWVIQGGHILTQDPAQPLATALAIKGGKILLVGKDAELEPLIGPQTKVTRLKGQTLLPGIIDSHIHSIEGALALQACNLQDQAMTLSALAEHILQCDKDYPGEWLEVLNLPSVGVDVDRWQLDRILPQRPLFIISTDGHTGWANSLALSLAGIDSQTTAPNDGRIVKDANQQPTGMLIDGATALISQHIPKPSLHQRKSALVKALQGFYQAGITAFLEANSNDSSIETFCALSAEGRLQAKVNLALGSKGQASEQEFTRLLALRAKAESCGLMADTIKLYADGVMEYPTQSAALHSPYLHNEEHGPDWAGKLYIPPPQLQDFVLMAQQRGFSVHIHAIGDAAIGESLDAFARARAQRPDKPVRFSITHLQLIASNDLPRFAQLDVLASMQLLWAQPDEYSVDALQPYLGKARHGQIYPAASLWRAGAAIAGGSDWNVSDYNPFAAMAVAISRQNLQEPERGTLNAKERLPLPVLLNAYTQQSARLLGMDSRIGQLKAGMNADLIILDRSLDSAISAAALAQVSVQMTLIDGNILYNASADKLNNN
ncbi:amidohydrolase [Bowmanella denitrificans]|uniref:Amidohydrolase n=1 Tax=Bowmanella denitrificans TaxID=366582 RepID=A0ABP3GZI7_9ALTE